MYELQRGSERLTNALFSIMDDERIVHSLTRQLCYIPEQFKEDILSMNDRINQHDDSFHEKELSWNGKRFFNTER
jgi:hypothetical protein